MSVMEVQDRPGSPSIVEPRNPRGTRDLDPRHMLARERVIDTIRDVYRLYGFVPLQTPAIEHFDVLFGSAGETSKKEIFHVQSPEGEHLGLRFDLTVPLARFVAQHPELPRPFRRYQISPVWRGDKPDKGRYREFTQFDIDSVGVPSELGDVEIIACMCDTMERLAFGRYEIRFSSRAILNLLLDFAGIPKEHGAAVFRLLDKLEKIGIEKVRHELLTGYRDESGARIGELTLAQVHRVEMFLDVRGERRHVVEQLRQLFRQIRGADEEIAILHNISERLHDMGYHDDRVVIDLSIARGLSYYTGPVFEAVALDLPGAGSIIGGGRYDDLLERFGCDRLPATGASIGIDRLLHVMETLGIAGRQKSTAHVLVTSIDPSLAGESLAMTKQLRDAGIPTELYLGEERSLKKQLKYGDHCEVPLALLYGSEEKRKGTVTIKDMAAGRKEAGTLQRVEYLVERRGQHEVSRAELVPAVRRMLAEIEARHD